MVIAKPTKKQLLGLILNLLLLLIFTEVWQHLAGFVERLTELVGFAFLKHALHNFLHSKTHELLHAAMHKLQQVKGHHRDHSA